MTEYRKLTPFQRALLDSVLMEHEDVMTETEPVVFSEQFLSWSQKLINQTKSALSFGTKRIVRIVLIAALIAALLAGCAMAIPAVREAIIDFFLQTQDDRVGITFNPEEAATAPNVIETTYVFTGIPDGYEMVVNDVVPNQVNTWWVNDQDQWITYYQFIIPDNATADNWLALELPDEGREARIIGDYLVEIVRSEGFYHLVWTNNEYVFVLELPEVINDETMHQIFASWQPEISE